MAKSNFARFSGRGFGVRSLANLEATASTARVLNLVSVARESGMTGDYRQRPFFVSRPLNTCLLVKHRLRRDESYMVQSGSQVTTKIILPLNRDELGLGAQSVMVGQRGWKDAVKDLCAGDEEIFERDLHVLELLNDLPSFDPFLLREHLRRRNIDVAPCYFAISPADVEKMRGFVAEELSQLIMLAYDGQEAGDLDQTAKLVSTLLSTRIDAKLGPLRMTFGMDEETFREGVFSWKGFLYYKWSIADLRSQLTATMREIGKLSIVEPCDPDTAQIIERSRRRLKREIPPQHEAILNALSVYNAAFRDLTHNNNPRAFREFLIKAPEMFMDLGEKLGVISHITSFWRYRFPEGAKLVADGPGAFDLLRDFEVSMGIREEGAPIEPLKTRKPRAMA
jgi:hypothetical protein